MTDIYRVFKEKRKSLFLENISATAFINPSSITHFFCKVINYFNKTKENMNLTSVKKQSNQSIILSTLSCSGVYNNNFVQILHNVQQINVVFWFLTLSKYVIEKGINLLFGHFKPKIPFALTL